MSSNVISPSIDQAKLLTFEKNFYKLAQQKDSLLLSSPAISFMPIKGVSHISRLGRTELVNVSGERNPEKQFSQMQNDNRRTTNYRYTKTFLVDNYDAAVQLITDPTSDLFTQLTYAKNREADRVIITAAGAAVVTGAPDSAGTSTSFANDGGRTVDGTSSFTYANVLTKVTRNFKNNEILANGITFAMSANEEYSLKQDDKVINNDYTNYRPVNDGQIGRLDGHNFVIFAGTETGGVSITNPILPEASGVRTNYAMAPDAIAFGMEIGRLDVTRSATHVNSWEITIDVYFKAVRKEGVKVQKITSTI